MTLGNLDIEAGMRRLADRRIEEAMKEGKFDNLAGAGQPLNLEPLPADENARMLWWALKIMRNSDFIPDEVRWRKQIDILIERIGQLRDDSELAGLVHQVNSLVRHINTLGTNAIGLPVVLLDLETERARFRERTATATPAPALREQNATHHAGVSAPERRGPC